MEHAAAATVTQTITATAPGRRILKVLPRPFSNASSIAPVSVPVKADPRWDLARDDSSGKTSFGAPRVRAVAQRGMGVRTRVPFRPTVHRGPPEDDGVARRVDSRPRLRGPVNTNQKAGPSAVHALGAGQVAFWSAPQSGGDGRLKSSRPDSESRRRAIAGLG